MATEVGTLVIDLKAQVSRLERDMKRTADGVKRGTDQIEASARFAKRALASMAAAIGGFAAINQVIATTKRFEASISDLSAITGATGRDLQFLADKSKEFGATTTLSASQAAEAFKLVASAKPDLLENAEALSTVTRSAITLAEASGSTLPDAAKVVGSALNQFGADAEEASRFVNVLAAGAKFGASEIADTAMALKDAGLVAASSGLSFEELNAAIQAMSTVSLKGSQAGTGLKNVLLSLTTQSNTQINPAVVGMTQAFQNLAASNLSAQELLKLFGRENVTTARALIQNADSLDELTDKLTGTETATEQALVKVDNLEGDTKKLTSAWEALSIHLGEKANPGLRLVTQTLTGLVTATLHSGEAGLSTVGAWRIVADSMKTVANVAFITMKEFNDLGDLLGAWFAKLKIERGTLADSVATSMGVERESVRNIIESRKEARAQTEREIEAFLRRTDGIDENIKKERELLEEIRKRNSANQLGNAAGVVGGQSTVAAALSGGDEDDDKTQQRLLANLQRRHKTLADSLLSERELEVQNFQERNLLLGEAWVNDLVTDQEFQTQRETIAAQHRDRLNKIDKQGLDARQLMWTQAYEGNLASISGVLGEVSGLMQSESKKQFNIGKAAARAQVLVDGARMIQSAYATTPFFPLGLAMGVSAIALAATNLQRINSIQFQGGGSVGGAVPTFAANPNTGLPIGSPGGGFNPAPPPAASDAGPGVTIIIQNSGPVVGSGGMQEFVDNHVLPAFADAVNNRDVVPVSRNSAFAREIVQAEV